MNSENYKAQNRGGVGIKGMTTNEEDFVENIVSMTTHDDILFFTNKGRVYRMRGYEVPLYSRQSKGLPIINLLPLENEELVRVMLKITPSEVSEDHNLVFCTQSGLVKKTSLTEFENIRANGKIAITLKEDDELISVKKTTGSEEILIASSNGRMVRFVESEIRNMGRTASGVKGIDVGDGKVIGCEVCSGDKKVLVVTENGYGKKTPISEYRLTHRGSKGVKALNVTEKNGPLIALLSVSDLNDLVIITDSGVVMRMSLEQVSTLGRATQGVRLIRLKDDQKVATVSLVMKDDENEDENVESVEQINEVESSNEVVEEGQVE
jgi:DNA gyrase subunit A